MIIAYLISNPQFNIYETFYISLHGNTTHRHNLRGAQYNLNTEALKKSSRYRGAVSWNSLSAEANQATTLNSFYSAIV